MTIRYFIPKPTTIEDLKAAYRALAMQHHPDRGGDTETMKIINNEYDNLFETVKNIHRNASGETYTKETTETPDQYREVVSKLITLNMDGVEIKLIGSFLWVSGNTRPYKDEIKALGFKWSNNKVAWYLSPPGYKKYNNKQYSLDNIRDMFGSQNVRNPEERVTLTA